MATLSTDRRKTLAHDYLHSQGDAHSDRHFSAVTPPSAVDRFRAAFERGRNAVHRPPTAHDSQPQPSISPPLGRGSEASRTATLSSWEEKMQQRIALEMERKQLAERELKRQSEHSMDEDFER